MSHEEFVNIDYRMLQDSFSLAMWALRKIYGNPNDYMKNGKVYQTYNGLKAISTELYQLEAENRIKADNMERNRNVYSREDSQHIVLKIQNRNHFD